MKKILIPIALLFAGFKVSAQSTDVRKFSFNLGVRMPVTLTFNNPDGATKQATMEVGSIDGDGNITTINATGLIYNLPSITATNPFELRGGLASSFWKKADGTDTDISASETDAKSLAVKIVTSPNRTTEEGADIIIDNGGNATLESGRQVLLAYSDNAMTIQKGVMTSYQVIPKGLRADDLEARVSMMVNYSLFAK